MHIINIGDQEYKSPSKWDEVTTRDLLEIATYTGSERYASFTSFFLIVSLFRIPKKLFIHLKQSQKIQLTACVDWVFTKNSLSRWLIKLVKVGSTTLYGPQNKLSDLTAEEFMYAEAAYERWLETTDTVYFDTLFAVLYRKKRFFFNKRVAFNAEKIAQYEQMAKKVRPYVKKAIAINYSGCRNLIIDRHMYIWEKAEANAKEISKKVPKTLWASIFMDAAETGVFGPWETIIKTNLWLVLSHIDKKARQFKELEGKNKK